LVSATIASISVSKPPAHSSTINSSSKCTMFHRQARTQVRMHASSHIRTHARTQVRMQASTHASTHASKHANKHTRTHARSTTLPPRVDRNAVLAMEKGGCSMQNVIHHEVMDTRDKRPNESHHTMTNDASRTLKLAVQMLTVMITLKCPSTRRMLSRCVTCQRRMLSRYDSYQGPMLSRYVTYQGPILSRYVTYQDRA
jgi:hypothetical protein